MRFIARLIVKAPEGISAMKVHIKSPISMKLFNLLPFLCMAAMAPLGAWQLSNNQEPESYNGVYKVEPGDFEVLAQTDFSEEGIFSFHVFLPLNGDVLVSVSELYSILLYLDETNVVHLLASNESQEFEEVSSWSEDGDRWIILTVDTTNPISRVLVEDKWSCETAITGLIAVTGNVDFYLTDVKAETVKDIVVDLKLQNEEIVLSASELIWTRGKSSIDLAGADSMGKVKLPSVLDPSTQPGGRFTRLIERPIKSKAILSAPASASFDIQEER